ncbi:dienelactone hydrolase family protein [Xanthobacter agilis]|uniref:Pimeloyl-ACP methyl ester carboxylesterase n=1 Tax=Xanthobacter agilis TaxID=47492 RepID=A0ABU0LBY8_XANAG|nr:dienelactone hydrolase family protein [Xanthobacter agilis]MDQ0504644.1 pimeloyl-ACP methyl ester carboxylesterase [Xanthobacter agilis]
MSPVSAPGHDVSVAPLGLAGELCVPPQARALVVFAHGSGSGFQSPRNRQVAEYLHGEGFATLLFDLLLPEESGDPRKMFDPMLLSDRLLGAVDWAATVPGLGALPVGLFGASTGAAAALVTAARAPDRVGAIVARGGRPDLVLAVLALVRVPTLLLVGGADAEVLELNRRALIRFGGPVALEVIPGAHHLFEEPGALDQVARRAGGWFRQHLCSGGQTP